MLSYVRWQPDAYERAFHLPPNSVWKPDPFDDEEQPESSEKRDQVGGYVENDTFLPMRKPWLQTGNGGLNSQLNVAANNSGLANGPLPGGGNPPENVGGFKRASVPGSLTHIDANTDLYDLIEDNSPIDAFYSLSGELAYIQKQDANDPEMEAIIAQFGNEWKAATTQAEQTKVLGQMADYITQYYQFYSGFLQGMESGNDIPTGKSFFRSAEGSEIWQDMEAVRVAYNTGGEAAAEYKSFMDLAEYVATVAAQTGDDTTILGLKPKIPEGLVYSTSDMLRYAQGIVNYDQSNNTHYARLIARMMYNRGPTSADPSTNNITQGFWGSYSGTDTNGDPITVYGNLFNVSEDASNAITQQNPQALAQKGTQSNELDQWQFFLQNEQVSFNNGSGTTTQTESYTSLQFKVAIADAMSQTIMIWNQIYNNWTPSAADISYQASINGDQIIMVTNSGSGTVVPPTPLTPPDVVPIGTITPMPTPTWEKVALGAGGVLLVYLVFRAV